MSIHKIFLKQDGSFTEDPAKIFYVKLDEIVKVQFASRKFKTLVPILLTDLNFEKIRSKSKLLSTLEVTAPQEVTRKEIEEKYTVFYGEFDDEGDWNAEVAFCATGPHFLQIVFVSNLEHQKDKFRIREFGRPEWFVVEPILKINNKVVSSRQVIMQTLISKCMGPVDRWEALIKAQTTLNYNAFHITPIQKYGFSGSCYSINDQLGYSVINFPNMSSEEAYKTLSKTVKFLEEKYHALFLIDVLLNHTSYDSAWLLEHPDACYNTHNTPSLTSAYLLDQSIVDFSNAIATKTCPDYAETSLRTEEQLERLMELIRHKVVGPLKLEEYFLMDEKALIDKFKKKLYEQAQNIQLEDTHNEELDDLYNIFVDDRVVQITKVISENLQNIGAAPYGVTFNFDKVCEHFIKEPSKSSFDLLGQAIRKTNDLNFKRAKGYLEEAFVNIRKELLDCRVKGNNHEITTTNHLINPYFTNLKDDKTKAAHNGWMNGVDVFEDFADSDKLYFLRRTINIWGDLIKLRYGKSKHDSPHLWKRMKNYVVGMAKVFHGLRIDNAHSTPIHVGEYFVRKARKANPSIYVFAELLTGLKEVDALFAKRLGLNGIVREALHTSRPQDLAEHIFFNSSGKEFIVGSLDPYYEIDDRSGKFVHLLKPRIPEPIFYDLTHDNESYKHSRTYMDTLSTSALISMSNCMIASTKGHDELYEKRVSVSHEYRFYSYEHDLFGNEHKVQDVQVNFDLDLKSEHHQVEIKGQWNDWSHGYNMSHVKDGFYKASMNIKPGKYEFKYIVNGQWTTDPSKATNQAGNHELDLRGQRTIYTNIAKLRQSLNHLHKKMCEKYPSFYSYQPAEDVIVIQRENPSKLGSYVLITRSAFKHGVSSEFSVVISLPGIIQKVKMICYIKDEIKEIGNKSDELQGIEGVVVEETDLHNFADISVTDSETSKVKKYHCLKFKYMPPSFVCVLKIKLHESQIEPVKILEDLQKVDHNSLYHTLAEHLLATDINHLYFSCSPEEKEKSGEKLDTYVLEGHGHLPYAGFGGMLNQIRTAQRHNDLGIRLFENLRNGDWLLDYILSRLKGHQNLAPLAEWLSIYFDYLRVIPRHLVPRYFTRIFNIVQSLIEIKTLDKLKPITDSLKKYSLFRRLILASYQMVADIPSARVEGFKETLAAGLPNLSTSGTRCWGRDTFISFKGVVLVPGLYRVAKDLILMFASSVRHGLIPNLLDRCIKPRYNARDVTWWFIKAVGDYIQFTGDKDILQEKIQMRFLSDNEQEHEQKLANGETRVLPLQDIIQEMLQKHATGIRFREWGAGDKLDPDMKYDGFNIDLSLDVYTGFIVGGNSSNCLTWMDKMGSSHKADHKGEPASPRDGAPIELTALLFCVLKQLVQWNTNKWYSGDRVITTSGQELTFKDWSEKIQRKFEFYYWIPVKEEELKNYVLEIQLVKRLGIYRDTIKASNPKSEYVLRPNGCIAIAVAPELFYPDKAYRYMKTVEKTLIKEESLGVKSLDPYEEDYHATYDLDDDSSKPTVAQGFNLHNGPEWLWIFGMFLLSGIQMFTQELTFPGFMSFLANHKKYFEESDWISLPNMTNDNGTHCKFSCPAQAWSLAVILEAYYEAKQRLKK